MKESKMGELAMLRLCSSGLSAVAWDKLETIRDLGAGMKYAPMLPLCRKLGELKRAYDRRVQYEFSWEGGLLEDSVEKFVEDTKGVSDEITEAAMKATEGRVPDPDVRLLIAAFYEASVALSSLMRFSTMVQPSMDEDGAGFSFMPPELRECAEMFWRMRKGFREAGDKGPGFVPPEEYAQLVDAMSKRMVEMGE